MEEQLQPDETLLVCCGNVCATDRRIVRDVPQSPWRMRRTRSGRVQSLPYRWIESVRVVSKVRIVLVALGVIVATLGMVANPRDPLPTVTLVLGSLAVVFGVAVRSYALEITSKSNGGPEVSRWGLGDVGRDAAQGLVRTIRLAVADPAPGVPPTPEHGAASAARSVLLVPADRPGEVQEGLAASPDALCLDLTESVPGERRDLARQLLWAEVVAVSHSPTEVWVRLTHDEPAADLQACVWPGLRGVVARIGSPEELQRLETMLDLLEQVRRVPSPVPIVVEAGTDEELGIVRGLAAASSRVRAVAAPLGVTEGGPAPFDGQGTGASTDKCPSPSGPHLLAFLPRRAVEGAATDPPLGAEGAVANAVREGFSGALTSDRAAVAACNAGFAPMPQEAASTPLGATARPVERAADAWPADRPAYAGSDDLGTEAWGSGATDASERDIERDTPQG